MLKPTPYLAVFLILGGCATRAAQPGPDAPPPPPGPARDLTPEQALAAALADAAVAEPGEEVDDLIALVPDNAALTWQSYRAEGGERQRVLLATWTDWTGYRDSLAQSLELGRQQWVTAVPELRAFCQKTGLSGSPLERRLEQYLGLRPGAGKTHVVELWIDPGDVVRPCPDPEVNDTTCSATAAPADVTVGTHQHRAWFEDLRATSYGAEGYPWTRLGYTYDWGPGRSRRGASEFVVPQGTAVMVESFIATADYCRP